jgi:hypothetical protein
MGTLTDCCAEPKKSAVQMILSRLLPFLLIATMMSTGQESLTISQLPIPFPPEDKPLCISVSEDGNLSAYQSRRTDGKGGADIWMSRSQRWALVATL